MNFFIVRFDNLILESEHISIFEDDSFRVLLFSNQGRIMIGEKDVRPLLYNAHLREAIGYIRFDSLLQHPIMLFSMPSDEWDMEEHTKSECDKKYNDSAFGFQLIALCFSLGAWLVKDSCLAVKHGYWMNAFNGYVSISSTDYEPTKSSGVLQPDVFSEEEIKRAADFVDVIAKYLFTPNSGIPLVQSNYGGTTSFSQERAAGMLGATGKSFMRALLKLQEARRAGDITSKIEYGCSALEALFAVSERHRYNLKTITAGYIGDTDSDKAKIKALMNVVYGIRSDHSHGDYIQYLHSNGLNSLEQVSSEFDEILRQVFRKTLKQPELNYSSEQSDIDRVRRYWDSVRDE